MRALIRSCVSNIDDLNIYLSVERMNPVVSSLSLNNIFSQVFVEFLSFYDVLRHGSLYWNTLF